MLHAIVSYYSADGMTEFKINDQTGINSNWTGGDPFYISVDAVDGLSSADISFESHPLPNMIGEKSGDVFRRGKTITLTGTIWGSYYNALNLGALYLEHMFWDVASRKLTFYPNAASSARVYLKTRVNNDLSISRAKPSDFVPRWGWVVGLRADDPRLYNYSGDTVYQSWMS